VPRKRDHHTLASLQRSPSLPKKPLPTALSMADEVLYNGRNITFSANAAPTFEDVTEYRGASADFSAAAHSTTVRADLTPVQLEWGDLTFDVPSKKRIQSKRKDDSMLVAAESEKQWIPPTMDKLMDGRRDDSVRSADNKGLSRVLHGCNGMVNSGEMLAIIGSSGAGKSTVLNLLAGRIKSSKDCVSGGTVLVNGMKRDFSTYKKLAAFVEQDDCMFGTLTVEEQLRYAALLRLPGSMSRERKLLKVKDVLQELGLTKCKDNLIGNDLIKGVSGGERKRCSIGMELVISPSCVLLDEPTSSLDAASALNVIITLRQLASAGRTIVATIHQPRSSIFALFDKLLVLSEGRTMYFGPAQQVASFFSSVGYTCPPHFNVADYVIDVTSVDYRSKELETKAKKRILYLAAQHGTRDETGALEQGNRETPSKDDAIRETERTAHTGNRQRSFQHPWRGEFIILLRRAVLKLSREKFINTMRLTQTIVFGILLGLTWLDAGRHEDLIAARSVAGVLFFLAADMSFDSSFACLFDFPLERAVLTRERASGSYRVSAYWWAGLVVDLFKSFILNVIMTTLVYWMAGLRGSATRFMFAILTLILTSLCGEAMGQAVSVFSGDAQISSALVPLFLVLAFLFGGFFIVPSAMPVWIRWGRFLSFLYWSYAALARNEFDGREGERFEIVLSDFDDVSRWGNLAVVFVNVVILKGMYFLALASQRPRFEKTL
jgi:ABC-type multidrug transport system ATPase subunit